MLAPMAQPALENGPAFFAKLLWLFSALLNYGTTAVLGGTTAVLG